MKIYFKYFLFLITLVLTACSEHKKEDIDTTNSKELQYFKKVKNQSFKSNYGTVEILLPECITNSYTTEISLTDINNHICESRGLYFSVDAVSSYKLIKNYPFKYTQKHKSENDSPKNPVAYLIDYAIEKRIQVLTDYISSEFQTYTSKKGSKLWVKSVYGHKNKLAEEQFYFFGGFIENEVCFIFQFICLNANSKYYFNDFIHFLKSAVIYENY